MRVRAKLAGFYNGRRIRAGTTFDLNAGEKPARWMEVVKTKAPPPPAAVVPDTSAPKPAAPSPLTSAGLPLKPMTLEPPPAAPPVKASTEPDTMSALTAATPVPPGQTPTPTNEGTEEDFLP